VTVKFDELVAVPPGVVTVILPDVAPAGTFVVILLAEFTVNVALTPLNFTDVAPVKLLPLIVTEVPTGPLVGENDVIVGPPVTVNVPELVSEQAGVVTLILPVVAPDGTVAVIFDEELTVKDADVPLNFTEVAPLKFEPLIVTDVPTGPLVGENDEIVGAELEVTWKLVPLVAVPSGVVTWILPLLAPDGTVAVIWVEELAVNVAAVAPKLTPVVPVKLVPVIVTVVPTGPLVGENEEIVGAAA